MFFVFLLILVVVSDVYGIERCRALVPDIRVAHYRFFGLDYPWWFSVGQAEKESLCRHNLLSMDGIGSEGFAQITWRWWRDELMKAGISEIKSIHNHALAQAYILKREFDRSVCRKLFEMYQRYNGGDLVSRELKRANSCSWADGYRVCKRKDVCVWVDGAGCRQWRNACDINYSYSKRVYESGLRYKVGSDSGAYIFW